MTFIDFYALCKEIHCLSLAYVTLAFGSQNKNYTGKIQKLNSLPMYAHTLLYSHFLSVYLREIYLTYSQTSNYSAIINVVSKNE